MIWILAGTGDGRQLAWRLEQQGWPVLASSVSEYGQVLLQESMQGRVLAGPMDVLAMEETIRGYGVRLVVDATHPYAMEVTRNIGQACRQAQVPWLRYERSSPGREEASLLQGVTWAADALAAARQAAAYPGGIFLATGSRTLDIFVRELCPRRLIVRVLPTVESLQACLQAGIRPDRIAALQGPFSVEVNRALLRHYDARVLVTKESGREGGFLDKLEAARQLEIPVIAIRRPVHGEGTVFTAVDDLLEFVAAFFGPDERREAPRG